MLSLPSQSKSLSYLCAMNLTSDINTQKNKKNKNYFTQHVYVAPIVNCSDNT